jgi:squalene-associated FAD-dependent desaturase
MTHDKVIIAGGGLAGLAAATALAPRGFQVTVLESRNRLGGRAASFVDAATGQLLDNCQHVSMGCCTNFAHFCRTLGIDHLLQAQPCLHFMTPDGKFSRFQADRLPAPLHLARAFLGAHYLTLAEKMRLVWALLILRHAPPAGDPPFLEWLLQHRQTRRTIDRFWSVVLTSALNEGIDRVGLVPARKVFVDGFLRRRHGCRIDLPAVPLSKLYGDELKAWFENHGVQVLHNAAVKRFEIDQGAIRTLTLRTGETMAADWYVSAVPFSRLLEIFPEPLVEREPYFANLRNLETSPITSVHLWFDRLVMSLPHVVLLDSVGQWVFNRGQSGPGEHYLQVVVSAAREFRGLGHDEVQRRIHDELIRLFPLVATAALVRGRVVTEHAATFSVVPGVDRWRPKQASPIPNLLVAGDWTQTGWPATMESAVRSGYLAAEALLERVGRKEKLLQPDL